MEFSLLYKVLYVKGSQFQNGYDLAFGREVSSIPKENDALDFDAGSETGLDESTGNAPQPDLHSSVAVEGCAKAWRFCGPTAPL